MDYPILIIAASLGKSIRLKRVKQIGGCDDDVIAVSLTWTITRIPNFIVTTGNWDIIYIKTIKSSIDRACQKLASVYIRYASDSWAFDASKFAASTNWWEFWWWHWFMVPVSCIWLVTVNPGGPAWDAGTSTDLMINENLELANYLFYTAQQKFSTDK